VVHRALVDDASKLANAIPGVKAVESQTVGKHGPLALTRLAAARSIVVGN